jgi:hypothetical protein
MEIDGRRGHMLVSCQPGEQGKPGQLAIRGTKGAIQARKSDEGKAI